MFTSASAFVLRLEPEMFRLVRVRSCSRPGFPCRGTRHFHKIRLMSSGGSEPIAANGRPRDTFYREFVMAAHDPAAAAFLDPFDPGRIS